MSRDYYNEHAIASSQAQMADSPCDRAAHDTSGIAPKPLSASGSSVRCAMRQHAHALACAPRRARAVRRMLRIRVAHLGWCVESEQGFHLASSFAASGSGKQAPFLGGASETHAPTSRYWRGGNHQSIATCLLGQARLGISHRKHDRCGGLLGRRLNAPSAIAPCIVRNSTYGATETAGTHDHTERMSL